MLLKNKVVLVTGSTHGIGEAIARRAVAEGAQVMIHGLDESRAKEICKELGHQTTYCIADLMDAKTPEILVQNTVAAFKKIDVVINNAGIYPRSTIESATLELYERVMTINVRAPFFISQAAIRQFRKQDSEGAIVNIGSINAYCGEVGMTIYAPSKGALMSMTRNFANEVAAEKIRINLINVGWTITNTEIQLKQSQGFSADWEKYIPKTYAPTGKLLRPEQVAAHAVFWASDQSKPANGQVYELEQYAVIGRNLINEIPLDIFPRD